MASGRSELSISLKGISDSSDMCERLWQDIEDDVETHTDGVIDCQVQMAIIENNLLASKIRICRMKHVSFQIQSLINRVDEMKNQCALEADIVAKQTDTSPQ